MAADKNELDDDLPPADDGNPYGPSDRSRFGWGGMDQIRPLHGDGTPYSPEEIVALQAYHRERALARKQAEAAEATDTEDNPPSDAELAATFDDDLLS